MKIKFISILFFLITCFIYSNIIDKNQGIILLEKANIYEMPDQSSKIINSLNKNEIFIISDIKIITSNDKNDYFLKIEKDKKNLGWVYKRDVGVNVFSDKINFDNKNLNFSKYIDLIKSNNVELWFAITSYDFEQYFFGIVLSTNLDNKLIKWISEDTDIKLFEYKDINDDGEKEILIENNWHAWTDPTNGSTFDIYSTANNTISNIYNINTSYASHEFELYFNFISIKNKEIIVSKIYLGKGQYHENGKIDFGTFWTIPIMKKDTYFLWDSVKKTYNIKSEKDNVTIKCKSLVDSLRMREKPNLNAKIIKGISKDEEFIVKETTEGYPEDKIELQPGKFGYWVNLISKDNLSGWAFSYYLDFFDNYLNSYMKYEGNEKDLFMSLTKTKFVEIK